MASQLQKEVKKWGNSGGVQVDKNLIGQKVYIITEDDLKLINALSGGILNGK